MESKSLTNMAEESFPNFDIATFLEVLEIVLRHYIEVLRFEIDIAAGIIIGISAIIALISS